MPFLNISCLDGRVPRPDGQGKIEGRDYADRAQRMPLLVHAVRGALRVHRETVQLPRETDGEVADIDHLLYLTVSLGAYLAHLEGNKVTERLLELAMSCTELPHYRGIV